jgi:glycosyltransferase involved in cell wall biosynthesis
MVPSRILAKSKPTVSICLPVYNGADYLAQAIESALSQTAENFELLIADDVSQDSSAEIARQYAAKDDRIVYWKNETNQGLFGNYNECMRRSSGQYIKLFAQDDIFAPNILACMLEAFSAHPEVALVACARKIVDAHGQVSKIVSEYPETVVLDGSLKVRDDLLKISNGIGEPSTVMFPRHFIGESFDTKLYHLGDIDYWHRIILDHKFLYLSEPLCSFRRHLGSTTSRNARGMRYALDMLHLGKKYKDFLASHGISAEAFSDICIESIASHMKYLVDRQEFVLEQLLAEQNRDKDLLLEELSGFKELTYGAMCMVGELLAERVALKNEWEEERNRLEATIATLIKSRSWKMTLPLRTAVKAIHAVQPKLNKERT